MKLILRLLLALLPIAAHAACVVTPKATIALRITAGQVTLPVEVNGLTATFVLDTGAGRSLVTAEAVQRLGLARDEWVGTTMRGIGGIDRRPNADPRSLSLGGVPLVRRTLKHDNSLTVGLLPGANATNSAVDGLLGRDFLSLFDLDLDMPSSRLSLYQVDGCSGRFLPWSGGYASIPITVEIPTGQAVVLPVTIDGKPLNAMLDSGATASLLAAPAMYKLGLNEASLAADPSGRMTGVGSRTVVVHRHRFHSLTVGGRTIELPLLWVEPIRLPLIVDMLLGADWLAGRQVWVSFATRQLFVAD